jgi:hypothetical protein
MPVNEAWHLEHPMPPRAGTRQRAEWHLEHSRECGCRPIPPRLREQMVAWGMLPGETPAGTS